MNGVTDSARAELSARLPIKLGEIISPESIERGVAAVHEFDQRLGRRFMRADDGG